MATLPAQRFVFREKQQVELEAFELADPGEGQVRVRVERSLMSTGTENIVFNRLFAPGTHWDNWVKYPFYPGYAAAGTVESVGGGVTALKAGDRVALRIGHASHAVVSAETCYPIPDGVPTEQAIWFALAKIAFQSTQASQLRLGDTVAILGAGPVGQMALRWARACGARQVVVIDPVPQRERFALAGGAARYQACPAGEAKAQVEELLGGTLPSVVIDSTGHAAVFAAALDLAERNARVVVLGDTGTPAQQHLTGDVIIKGLVIAGAHDGTKFVGWDEPKTVRLFFQLAGDGRFALDGLTTHTFQPADCAEAYATANRDRAQTMGIVFNWNA